MRQLEHRTVRGVRNPSRREYNGTLLRRRVETGLACAPHAGLLESDHAGPERAGHLGGSVGGGGIDNDDLKPD